MPTDWTLTAESSSVTVSGVTGLGWACEGGAMVGDASVVVADGADVECT